MDQRHSEGGLTLRDAAMRFGNPEFLAACKAAEEYLRAVGGPTPIIHPGIDASGGEVAHVQRRRHAMKAVDRAWLEFGESFWQRVVRGELEVWGRKASPSAPRLKIDAAFQYMTPDYPNDLVREAGGVIFYDVRIKAREQRPAADPAEQARLSRSSWAAAIRGIVTEADPALPRGLPKEEVRMRVEQTLGRISNDSFHQLWRENTPDSWRQAGRKKAAEGIARKSPGSQR